MFQGDLLGLPMENEIGLQARYDDIQVGLFNTARRQYPLDRAGRPRAGGERGALPRESGALDRLAAHHRRRSRRRLRRQRLGLHHPSNSGKATDGIVSPKLGLVLGPFADTELYRELRRGLPQQRCARRHRHGRFREPAVQPQQRALPRPLGGLGDRRPHAAIEGLESALSLFQLDFDSENLFQGDSGTTEPSRPTRRYGVEWTNRYRLNPWLSLDLDATCDHQSRFADRDPAGSRIPEAPTVIGAAGVTFGEALGWFGTLRLRYFGPRPLIEDNSVEVEPERPSFNGRLGYNFENGVSVSLDALNLFGAKSARSTISTSRASPASRPKASPTGTSSPWSQPPSG